MVLLSMSGTSMHRSLRLAVLLLLAAPAAAHAALTVPIDQTRRVTFGGTAANIVVGNPDIADVNVIDGRNLMVVGKRFGVTNLVVLDAAGRTLFDSEVVVSAGSGSISWRRRRPSGRSSPRGASPSPRSPYAGRRRRSTAAATAP